MSSIYRLAPPDETYASGIATQRRVEIRIQRLIREYGGHTVRERIRSAPGPVDIKARLVLLAFSGD